MQFEYGSARVVLCVGPWVVKFARIKIIYWVLRLASRVRRGNLVQVLEKKQDAEALPFARLRLLFLGIVSNLEEARFYRLNPHLPLAPTIFSCGVINVQRRVVPIYKEELGRCPFQHLSDLHVDFRKVEHYGWLGDQIYLVDYGNPEVNQLILDAQPARKFAYTF